LPFEKASFAATMTAAGDSAVAAGFAESVDGAAKPMRIIAAQQNKGLPLGTRMGLA
jgi:hypothetical protein